MHENVWEGNQRHPMPVIFGKEALLSKKVGRQMNDAGIYNCTFCGKEIALPIDVLAAEEREFVAD